MSEASNYDGTVTCCLVTMHSPQCRLEEKYVWQCIHMQIYKMQISGQVYLDITLSFAYLHEKIHEFRLRHANFGELGEGHSDHLQSTQIQTQTSVMEKSFETDIVILMNWETQLRRPGPLPNSF